jgi:PleD family two-component response regulator
VIAPLRVLLVQGDDDAAATLSLLRPADDVEVRHVTRLDEAAAHVARADCVLLDLDLPGVDGIDGLLTLRHLAPDTPIVVIGPADSEPLARSALAHGAQDTLERGHLSAAGVVASVMRAMRRKAAEGDLVASTLRDPLTGLANERLLRDRVSHALDRLARSQGTVAVLRLALDLRDGLDQTNRMDQSRLADRAPDDGFDGERALVTVAARIGAAVRRTDTLARVGDGAFVVLCDDIERRDEVREIAVRLVRQLDEPIADGEMQLRVQASLGGVVVNGLPASVDDALELARVAAQRAAARGPHAIELVDGVRPPG